MGMSISFQRLAKPCSEFGLNLSLSATADVYVGKDVPVFISLSSRLEDQLKNGVIFHPLNLSFLLEEGYVGLSASKFDLNTQLNWIKSWQFNGRDVDNNDDNESDNHRRQVYDTAGVIGGLALLFGVELFRFWVVEET
ncbi:hypothetical protein Csa_001169 [Cucumis sativus]|nr:hypothetical protein Csa_001169 [Cucumis sativus]